MPVSSPGMNVCTLFQSPSSPLTPPPNFLGDFSVLSRQVDIDNLKAVRFDQPPPAPRSLTKCHCLPLPVLRTPILRVRPASLPRYIVFRISTFRSCSPSVFFSLSPISSLRVSSHSRLIAFFVLTNANGVFFLHLSFHYPVPSSFPCPPVLSTFSF